ncbi:non-structural NS2, putative [Babesia ovata]|uniref:Non-structural NS2, putative n=1 Tax=Babesia ovata TaxID=189622 RepID=A0A2H6KA36_9APIC|nr:non-structural NS2, putative [Babesia ovata]GBE59864.1 non-structural NS2, putative [Babesia ovata]
MFFEVASVSAISLAASSFLISSIPVPCVWIAREMSELLLLALLYDELDALRLLLSHLLLLDGLAEVLAVAKVIRYGPVQQPEADGDHLQVPGAGGRVDDLRLGPDVVDVRHLEPRQVEVAAFPEGIVAHTACKAVEHHGALAAVHVDQTRAGHDGDRSREDGQLC